MSKILFLGMPSHGHVNPTIGLVAELVKQGEEVIYFCSPLFKEKIEATGAVYKAYAADLDIFKANAKGARPFEKFYNLIDISEAVIADIFEQIKDIEFDYMIYSVSFPFTSVFKQVLELPSVASLAIFTGLGDMLEKMGAAIPGAEELDEKYQQLRAIIKAKYYATMPGRILHLLYHTGDINLVYTSELFITDKDREFFDDSYKFVGPPVFERKEKVDFPFELIENKKVIYISLGTVFGSADAGIYQTFFKAFAGTPYTVVMTAFNVVTSNWRIPPNFIVRSYVPQSAILKYADAAITHAGMNSISDIIAHRVPFVSIPLGADQPLLAKRAAELGATISLDHKTLTPQQLRESVEKVIAEPDYLKNIEVIAQSFQTAGGYSKAVEEIFRMKEEKIDNR